MGSCGEQTVEVGECEAGLGDVEGEGEEVEDVRVGTGWFGGF